MKIIYIALFLAGLATLGMGIYYATTRIDYSKDNKDIRGQVYFDTEEQYAQFKRDLVNADLDIDNVKVLASELPIIVKFNFEDLPPNTIFPYGQEFPTHHNPPDWAIMMCIVGPWMSVSLLIFWRLGLLE